MVSGHEASIQESIDAVLKVHDRILRNQLIQRTMDRARIPAEVRLGMHQLMEFRQGSAMTNQQLRSLYTAVGYVIGYCRVLREEVLSEIRRTGAMAASPVGRDTQIRVLLKLTVDVFPTSFGEFCDRITDLLVAIHRADASLNGRAKSVLTSYPDLRSGLRELIELAEPAARGAGNVTGGAGAIGVPRRSS